MNGSLVWPLIIIDEIPGRPIEAKAEENVKAKSLRAYVTEHPDLKGLRVSMKGYIDQGWMENLPLFAIEGYLRAEGIPVPDVR